MFTIGGAYEQETAKGARSWYKLVRDSADESLLVAVCGFKADLSVRSRTPVKVPGVPYWPVSAKSNYNFEKPFLFFARRLTEYCRHHSLTRYMFDCLH